MVKWPGDGDYLVDDRSCFERFFCAYIQFGFLDLSNLFVFFITPIDSSPFLETCLDISLVGNLSLPILLDELNYLS